MTHATNWKPEKGAHKRSKGRKRRQQAQADKAVYQAVAVASGGCCGVCGRFGVQLHHRRFRSLGGKTTLENILPLCEICHRKAHRL